MSVTGHGAPVTVSDPNAAYTAVSDGPQRISLPLAWDRDRLVITDPKALAKINRKRLSASSMGAIHSCPARWVVEKLLPSESDPMGPAESGTSGHKVLEELFNLPGRMRTTDQADRLLSTFLDRHSNNTDLVLPDRSDDEAVEEWRGEVASAIHGLWQIEDPTKVQVASIEMGLDNVEIGGVPVIGYIDRTDFERTDGRFGRRVVDFKTGRRLPRVYHGSEDKYGDQLRIYALGVTALDGERPTSAHLYFTRLGKSIAVNLSRSALSDTERSFVSAWKKLQGFVEVSSVTGKSSPLCGWCPLASSCPIAARDGKNEMRSPTAEAGQLIDIPVITPLEKVVVAVSTDVDHGDFDYSAGDFAADTSADDFDTRTTSDVDPVDDVAGETPVEPDNEAELPSAALDYDPDQDFGAAAVLAAAAAAPDDEVFGASGNTTDLRPPSSYTTEAAPTRTTHDHIEGDTTMARWLEDKRWEEANSEGRLNPDSYAATAVVGLTTLAVDLLHRNGQPITKSTVRALTHTLALVVIEVQDKLQGKTNFNMGLNTRLRSSLYSTIKSMPLPFGGDAADWESWVARAQRRLEAIVLTAEELWEKGADANAPWAGLVGLTHPVAPAPVDDIGTDEALAG